MNRQSILDEVIDYGVDLNKIFIESDSESENNIDDPKLENLDQEMENKEKQKSDTEIEID